MVEIKGAVLMEMEGKRRNKRIDKLAMEERLVRNQHRNQTKAGGEVNDV